MTSLTRTHWVRVFLAALGLIAWAGCAAAADINSAKQNGLVGERPNGMLGIVDASAPGDVKRMVDEINAKRALQYRQVAEQTGTSLQAVMARAGAQLTARTPSGQYFQDASGRWRKR